MLDISSWLNPKTTTLTYYVIRGTNKIMLDYAGTTYNMPYT